MSIPFLGHFLIIYLLILFAFFYLKPFQVAENHQYYNAMAMVDRNAAQIIEEKDLTPEKLTAMVDSLAGDRKKLSKMSENARKMAILDSRERIYAVVSDVLKKHGKL